MNFLSLEGAMDSDKIEELHYHASEGNYGEVQSLLNEGVNPDGKNYLGRTPLMSAAMMWQRTVVELLLNSGADVHCSDNDGYTFLHYASSRYWVEIVQSLVSKGVDLDVKACNGRTALVRAAEFVSNSRVVELLIECGADVHYHDNCGWTVLYLSVLNGWVKIVKSLVKKGVALNTKTSDGNTPLMTAARLSFIEVAELLINSGADIHYCDEQGSTVLHYASLWNWVDIIQTLVNKGVALNTKKNDGNTPLHMAARSNNRETIDFLLQAGADCNVENNKGESPFNALVRGQIPNETIKLSIKKGAYVKSSDYYYMLKDPLLKEAILQDVKTCSQAVINKFNNKDLPLLYERHASARILPPIDKLQIGNKSGMVLVVEQAVTHEIQTNGYCNLSKIVPLGLSILCVKSALERLSPAFNLENLSESRSGLKRLGSCNKRDYPYKKKKTC